MPVALTTPLGWTAPPDPPRKLWTRTECAMLESTSLWDEAKLRKLELIEGELIQRMPKKQPM